MLLLRLSLSVPTAGAFKAVSLLTVLAVRGAWKADCAAVQRRAAAQRRPRRRRALRRSLPARAARAARRVRRDCD